MIIDDKANSLRENVLKKAEYMLSFLDSAPKNFLDDEQRLHKILFLEQLTINNFIFKLFIGKLTKKGKRQKAEKIAAHVLHLLSIDKELSRTSFFEAIHKLLPVLKIIKKRVGGVIYTLPLPILRTKNAISIALKNLIISSQIRAERTLPIKLVSEIRETLIGTSRSFKQKEALYNTATENVPFLHFLKRRRQKARYTGRSIRKRMYKNRLFGNYNLRFSKKDPNFFIRQKLLTRSIKLDD